MDFYEEKKQLLDEFRKPKTEKYLPETKAEIFRHNQQLMNDMSVFADQGDPKVGIFWYDIENDELLYPQSTDLDSGYVTRNGITIKKLHKDFWTKEYHRAKAKGKHDSIFMKDYTKIPRGRIFYKDGEFICFVGSWIKQCEKELNRQLKDEFDIKSNLIFKIRPHWELGCGWSEHDL